MGKNTYNFKTDKKFRQKLYRKAAVDDQIVSRQPARGVTQEIDGTIGDIVGQAIAA